MRIHATAIVILIGHLILFSLLNNLITPHPDMLDHWVWSRHLSLSYYEHPPMVAWAIRLFTTFAGNSETALEFAAQFYNLLILALSYGICYRLFGVRTAVFYLILLESTPYFLIGSVFLHIDLAVQSLFSLSFPQNPCNPMVDFDWHHRRFGRTLQIRHNLILYRRIAPSASL